MHAACYKHAAPLGLNAAELAARYLLWGEVTSPSGLGEPNPYAYSFALLTFQFSCLPVQMSPLWGFGYLVYAAFYKHAAPLGLNAPVLLSSNGLGNPTPTNSIVR